ncbi:MAG: hypothetical protein WKF85_10685 [Chitinophagaceae bacterium]
MFDSLHKVKINWMAFFIIIFLIRVLFPYISWYSYFALVITIHHFFLLFYSLNYVIPIRYLFGALMCLQMFVGPLLAYNGLDKFQPDIYQMKVTEAAYFSYVIPATILFILGLHFKAGKLKGEVLDVQFINSFANKYPYIPYFFIAIGFVSSFISVYFFTAGIKFLFYLISNFKFIGAFIVILSDKRIKILPLILIYGSVISSSLVGGLFHDLIIWLIILGAVIAIKYKPSSLVKVVFFSLFVILTITIQQLKGGYRTAISNNSESGIGTLTKTYEKSEAQNEIFQLENLAKSSVRINQGFIITNIMKKVPSQVPFSNGSELKQILEAAFLPRILAPNKLDAGDQTIFTNYTGIQLSRGTTMALSSIGDAYINFGVFGGCIFMLILGLLYNEVLKGFYKFSKNIPLLLLFTTVVFYFPIRPDSELQTNLGHLVKACFIIGLIFIIWKHKLADSKNIPLVSS